jgi:hypothetical protein
MVGEDETLTLAVKPEDLLGAQTAIAHSGCRGSGPMLCALSGLGSPLGLDRRTPFIQVTDRRALLRALAWQIASLGVRVLLGEPFQAKLLHLTLGASFDTVPCKSPDIPPHFKGVPIV